jgi:hypothetical protein
MRNENVQDDTDLDIDEETKLLFPHLLGDTAVCDVLNKVMGDMIRGRIERAKCGIKTTSEDVREEMSAIKDTLRGMVVQGRTQKELEDMLTESLLLNICHGYRLYKHNREESNDKTAALLAVARALEKSGLLPKEDSAESMN